MAYAYNGPEWIEITGPFTIEDQGYPADWADIVGEDARVAVGVVEIIEPEPAESGLVVTGSTLSDVDGVPHRAWITEAAPLPALVPMYKVKKYMALVKAQSGGEIDLHAGVMDYINGLPEPARTLARIDFGPDPEQIGSPNLVVQSQLAQNAKTAMNLDDETFATMIRAANALA